ncbi:hypothetical protein BLA24_26660 [Streptomyces cinnamoneus]|uniref:ATP-binding protein n=1 Tax=Streptomyces cinnamoneus TaxID=53446 RepID=A0A2G1XEH3_STRCJ|nr:hypothetical protein [Streptomyces cinnamoneus]PHQ49605.1 hypothetical protein BLA24_26660 [Streptomyces cinnamoneus]PPT14675.1 hypothetical protein CYQ11_18975 [Streptomyces cinnamoneus]
MKQATLKALGAVAVGAAIAASAAGTASAGTLESVTTTATGATKGLPIEQVAPIAPAGGPVLVATNRLIASGVLEQTAKAADHALAPHLPTEKLAAPTDNKGNAGLLGGLPTKAIAPNGISLPGIGTPNMR